MDHLQRTIINTLGTQPSIDAAKEVARRVEFLVDYLTTTGAAGFVLGISGGQDSTLAGKLAQMAADKVEGAHFYALRLRSEEHTSELQSRGHLVCRLLLEKKKG